MKYSLRSLMIVVTLVAVLLGVWTARIGYLTRMATFHEREAKRFDRLLIRKIDLEAERNKGSLVSGISIVGGDDIIASLYHKEMAKAFRQGLYCPWMPIAEPPVCTELRKDCAEIRVSPGFP